MGIANDMIRMQRYDQGHDWVQEYDQDMVAMSWGVMTRHRANDKWEGTRMTTKGTFSNSY